MVGFLAGFPTILGSVIGAFLYSNAIGTLFFAIASGALLYVIFELVAMVHAEERTKSMFAGMALGLVLMYRPAARNVGKGKANLSGTGRVVGLMTPL